MREVIIDDTNSQHEHEASASAIRDFLYTYWDISVDCLPVGDWERAELGTVDPFRFIDVEYVSEDISIRTPEEMLLLREGAAVNLLCRIALIIFQDYCDDSAVLPSFRFAVAKGADDEILGRISSELRAIYRAYADGRISNTPAIQAAFAAWLTGNNEFSRALETVRLAVIVPVFEKLG